MCGGGSTVEAPAPTREETELQQFQLAELKQSKAMNEAIQPVLLANMGYRSSVDASGNISLVPLSEQERASVLPASVLQDEAIYKEYQTLQMKALKGELDVSPALDEEIRQKQTQLEETLSQKLGPNWRMTTPGIQAQKSFDQSAYLAREEARRGQIGQGAQLLQGGMPSPSSQGLFSGQSAVLNPGLGLLSSTPGILQGYQNNRAMGFQANLANAQNKGQMWGSALGLLGQMGMAYGMSR